MILDGSASNDMDGQIINYTWKVSGNTYSYRSIEAVNFTSKGDYEIELAIRDDDGAMAVTNHSVSITDREPVAKAFINRTSAHFNVPIEFNGSRSFDFEGALASYHWDFGDGDVADGKVVTHKYRNSGMYSAVLTVTDVSGNTDADQLTILIENRPPIAIAGPNITTFARNNTAFSAYRCFDPDGDIADHVWEFGDGMVGRGITLTHEYQHPGIFTVTLSIFDNLGARAMDELTVTVVNYPPISDFEVRPPVPLPGEAALLDASGSMDVDGSLTSLRWMIGNVTIGEGYLLNHTFPGPGNYSVTLMVEDDCGAIVNKTKIIGVRDIPPIADAGTDQTVVMGTKVRFDGSGSTGQGDIRDYEWTFRDGDGEDGREVVLAGISPFYTFLRAGKFEVLLSVTDVGGNVGEDSVLVEVIPPSGFHLVMTSPAPEEMNVLPDADILLEFSAEVDRTSLDLLIRFLGHPPMTQFAHFEVSEDGKTVTIDPMESLRFGTRYEMFIPRNLTDTNDNELPCDINVSFTVIPAFEVISHSLDGNRTDVDTDDAIIITFNREPDVASVRNGTRLLDKNGGEVELEIDSMDDNLMIRVKTREDLGFEAKYNLYIDRTTRCTLGGGMEEDFEVAFTTRGAYPGETSKSSQKQTPKWVYILEVAVIVIILIVVFGYVMMRRTGKTTRDVWDRILVSFRKGSGKTRQDGTWDRGEGGRRRKRPDRNRRRRRPPGRSGEESGGHGEDRRRSDGSFGSTDRRGRGKRSGGRGRRGRGARRQQRPKEIPPEVVSFMVTGYERRDVSADLGPGGRGGRSGRYYEDYDYSDDFTDYDDAPYSRRYGEYESSGYGDEMAFENLFDDEDEGHDEYDYECPDCGASLYEDDTVCPDCGAEFDGEELVDEDIYSQPQGRYSGGYDDDYLSYGDKPYGWEEEFGYDDEYDDDDEDDDEYDDEYDDMGW